MLMDLPGVAGAEVAVTAAGVESEKFSLDSEESAMWWWWWW